MTEQHQAPPVWNRRERRILGLVIAVLLGTATCFRLMYLSSMPGVSGDEGWWGVQAIAWLSGGSYERHTTSGNPIDLFFLIPVALVHAMGPPSFTLLRTTPTVVNLLALPIGFWGVRRVYDGTTAWIYTIVLAVLPTAIAHSRICQDPSQSIFWTGSVIYLSLLGLKDHRRAWIYLAAAIVLFAVALWTHPTNVFAGAFVLLPCAAAVRPLLPASRRGRAILVAVATLVVFVALLLAWPALRQLAVSNAYLERALSSASVRITDGAQWLEFAANNVRLFNGVTVYHYFSGARPGTAPYDVVTVLVVGSALGGLLMAPRDDRRALDQGLLAACAMMWLGFYAFAGPQALRPHAERWGLCLIVPGTLVVSRGLAVLIEWKPQMRWATIGLSTVVAASLLIAFHANFFREFQATGGRSHLAYVTAATEPKQQALETILDRSTGSDPISIVAQQWWLYWPMAYLASARPHVAVTMHPDPEHQPGFQKALRDRRLYFVEFAGTAELAATIDWVHARGLTAATTTISDAAGRDLLQVLQVTSR